jgi:hypothetical protein
MGAQGAGAQGANATGAEDTEGFDDGPDEDGPEEMEAADGFDVSASARDEYDELRRHKPDPADTNDELDSPSTLDENKVPEPPAGSSDDDLQ